MRISSDRICELLRLSMLIVSTRSDGVGEMESVEDDEGAKDMLIVASVV